ncbi:plastocyanin/azurin family copper-binding protein [Pontibacter chitinilyticus]|uniref:plastocyanin/azurin family copper-binding protein n=1 Tax=Pontibacter chitinilyticus TaxID=2674989 RepID=UPI003219B6DE
MNRVFLIGVWSTALILTGCGESQQSTEEAAGTTATPLDTATAVSAPASIETDSLIQQVQELQLTAVGNTLEEMHFKQDTLQVKPGALVKLELINEAQDMPMVHNVVFTAPGKYKEVALEGAAIGASGNYVPEDKNVVAASPMALPGQTVEMEFTAPTQPGTYEFVCTYPDHWQRMNGIFVVK